MTFWKRQNLIDSKKKKKKKKKTVVAGLGGGWQMNRQITKDF